MDEYKKNQSKSATRALDIMGFLASSERPRRACDIAEAFDLARSSTDQLLKTLVDSGYLLIDPNTLCYAPSLRSAWIGHQLAKSVTNADRLREIIKEVHGESGEAVTLSVQNDCSMQMMAFAGGDYALEVGLQLPVLGSTIGSAVLTTKSSAAISKLIRRSRRQYVIAREDDWDETFFRQLQLFRMKGYSWRKIDGTSADRLRPPYDMWTLGIRLPDVCGVKDTVLGMAGPVWRVRAREGEMISLMRRAIRKNIDRHN